MNDFTDRVKKAYGLALLVARSLPHCARDDVAQNAVINMSDRLLEGEWQNIIRNESSRLVKAEARRIEKETVAHEQYKEWLVNTQKASEKKRMWLRDFVELALMREEWLVIHGTYWLNLTQEQIGKKMHLSQPSIHAIHKKAIYNIKLALRREGIDRNNVWNWFYE